MIAELSVVPIGVGESLSSYVSEVLKLLDEKGVKYELNPMGTVVEVDSFAELGKLLDEVKERLENLGVPRIYITLKVDWRKKKTSMEYKVKSVKEKLKG